MSDQAVPPRTETHFVLEAQRGQRVIDCLKKLPYEQVFEAIGILLSCPGLEKFLSDEDTKIVQGPQPQQPPK